MPVSGYAKNHPGSARLEKMAAAAGGVLNHRMGLFDAILIKNNHIALAGGVRPSGRWVHARRSAYRIEVRTHEEI